MRKPIAIGECNHEPTVICDDGSVWVCHAGYSYRDGDEDKRVDTYWRRLPNIPQDDEKE